MPKVRQRALSYLLEALSALRGYPREIVLDNGPEMTSTATFVWAQTHETIAGSGRSEDSRVRHFYALSDGLAEQ